MRALQHLHYDRRLPASRRGEKFLLCISHQSVVLLTAARADQDGTGTEGKDGAPLGDQQSAWRVPASQGPCEHPNH